MQDDWRYRCYLDGMIDQIHNWDPTCEAEDVIEEGSLEDINIHDIIKDCKTLSKKQRYIIERRYVYGDTFQAIADVIKCSKVYIFNQHKDALKKIKNYLGDQYAIQRW
jgi:DNA-directed RNA polymerase specialized sigma subunit